MLSTEKAIEVLYIVRAYYASLTGGYPKGEDCKGIDDVTCSEIANSCLMAIKSLRQEPVIDKIRVEIEELKNAPPCFDDMFEYKYAVDECLEIIDKYKESEV